MVLWAGPNRLASSAPGRSVSGLCQESWLAPASALGWDEAAKSSSECVVALKSWRECGERSVSVWTARMRGMGQWVLPSHMASATRGFPLQSILDQLANRLCSGSDSPRPYRSLNQKFSSHD